MATEIKVPTLGESVSTATVARWIRKAGDRVAADEPVVELETDKVTVEVGAPATGVLAISIAEGDEVEVGVVLGVIEAAGATAAPAANPAAGVNPPPRTLGPVSRPATPPSDVAAHAPLPAAAKLMTEQKLSADQISGGSG